MRSENIARRLKYLVDSKTYGVTEDAAYLCQHVLDFLFESCLSMPLPKVFATANGGLEVVFSGGDLVIKFESQDWLFSAQTSFEGISCREMPETGSLSDLLEFVRPFYPAGAVE